MTVNVNNISFNSWIADNVDMSTSFALHPWVNYFLTSKIFLIIIIIIFIITSIIIMIIVIVIIIIW